MVEGPNAVEPESESVMEPTMPCSGLDGCTSSTGDCVPIGFEPKTVPSAASAVDCENAIGLGGVIGIGEGWPSSCTEVS